MLRHARKGISAAYWKGLASFGGVHVGRYCETDASLASGWGDRIPQRRSRTTLRLCSGRGGRSQQPVSIAEPDFRLNLSSFHNLEVTVSGPENCDISARMATKLLWTARCSCSGTTPRHGSVVMLKELSAVAQQLRRFDVEGGLVGMLASLVTASHEFIGISDLEGNALFVNEAGRKLVGLRGLEAVLATRVIDYFAAEDQPKVLHVVLPAVRDTGYWEGELKFRNFETGQLTPVLYNIFPVRGSSGAITAYGTVNS